MKSNIEPLGRVRTKIVATLGPASNDPATIGRLIEAGVDCFRLNASHSHGDERSRMLRHVREAAAQLGRQIGVLLDLGGPKIRLGPIPGDLVECPASAEFRLLNGQDRQHPHDLTCTYINLARDLSVGDRVLFADGTVEMEVRSVDDAGAHLVVTLPGRLRSGQGLNLPGALLKVPALTSADMDDLNWLRDNSVDYVGLSFARSAADVELLRDELLSRGVRPRVVTKIEKPQAVENFDSILRVTEGVMVARGDLGVEVDVARVPAIQKQVLDACHRARVPSITATQMLNSMETSNRPTRAEASDVFNAVIDGTDAVMLSGETAIGAYPVEAVRMMSRIVAEAERVWPALWRDPGPITRGGWILPTTEAVVEAACAVSRRLEAALIVVATHSGKSALAVSKQRRATPTLALCDSAPIAQAMSLYWGVTPLVVDSLAEVESAVGFALKWAGARQLVNPGDRVVLIRGTIPGSVVHNAMMVEEIGT